MKKENKMVDCSKCKHSKKDKKNPGVVFCKKLSKETPPWTPKKICPLCK